jgi:tetratricopeptide (TPR) repeat protein
LISVIYLIENKKIKAMKTIILFAMSLAVSVFTDAQERSLNAEGQNVTPPQFSGKKFELLNMGKECNSLEDYLRGCACYPEECIKKMVSGTEVVEFVVTPEGTLTAFYVINSLSPEIDAHVISLLKKTSGMWTPGKIDNRAVPMRSEISIAFKWNEFKELKDPDFNRIAKVYFEKGSRQLLIQNKPEKALKNFNAGIRYLPKNESLLMLRGICRYELGDETGARNDWERMNALENSRSDFQQYADDLARFKGYNELSHLMNP